MALGADDPDWELRLLQVLAHLEVAERLEESQETHIALGLDPFEDEAVSEVSLAVVYVGLGLTYDHEVDDLLRCVPVLVEESAPLHVHIRLNALDASGQDNGVNEEDDSLAALARRVAELPTRGRRHVTQGDIEVAQVALHQVVQHHVELVAMDVLQDDLDALMRLDDLLLRGHRVLRDHQRDW